MPTIGPLELLVILVVALLVVGPRRLPEVGRSIGRALREFRRAQDEVRRTMSLDLDETPPATSPPNREGVDARGDPMRDPPPTSAEGEG
ncbi:MAG: twin-arginine translocase TatA/TatE family subunit [Actinomycetota bacterium]